MGTASDPRPEVLLRSAREGSREELGALIDLYRNYLHILARTQIDVHLNGRMSPSDLVQETMLEACRDFGQFRGDSEGELLAWLRRILVHNVSRAFEKHVQAEKRTVRRQVSFESRIHDLERSTAAASAALESRWSAPSARLHRRERAAVLADLLARLQPAHRDVIVLRDLEGLSFAEVAERMQRTPAAARQLWVRALDRLRQLLEAEDLL